MFKSVVAATALAVSVSCGGSEARSGSSVDARGLRAVTLPDLSPLDAAVQRQVRDREAAVAAVLERRLSTPSERADAFGRLGMVLDAAEYHAAAEPAYLNARDLSPDDPRWPYYLAHLYRSTGKTASAEAAFARVLALVPNHPASLVWLGRLHLEQGDVAAAEPLFARALADSPRLAAAAAGLGLAALARRDYARAATLLADALALDPSAASLHLPLATAHRELGDSRRAETHAAQWRNTEILVPDPWRSELDLTLESSLSFELRGIRALDRRNFAAAADFFRKGAVLEPGTTGLGRSLRHKLATALYLEGDVQGAMKQFREVVRLSPTTTPDETAARAHYSLGVLMGAQRRDDEAVAHLSAAVEYGPHYVEALWALGDALRRSGRARESLEPYQRAVAFDPRAADARFGYGMALVRLGRHREALGAFAEGARLHHDRPMFRQAMARLLAASPDAGVRDGRRALAIVDELIAGEKTIALGETTAMALAEVGNFTEAAAVQRQVIEAATRAGIAYDRSRLTAALRGYERNEPSRTPWADDDPAHNPRPAGATEAGALLAAGAPVSPSRGDDQRRDTGGAEREETRTTPSHR